MRYEEERALCDAVRDAYTHAAFRRVIYFSLGKSIDVISAESFEDVIFEVLMEAKRGGTLEAFVAAVLAGQPANPMLLQWKALYWRAQRSSPAVTSPAAPAQQPAQQLMDSAYFDLTAVRKAIDDAMTAPASQVIGFGVSYPEPKFVEKLSDWLHWYLGPQTEPRGPFGLNPATGSVPLRLEQLRRHRNRLDKLNMVCEIVVDGAAPAAHVAEFWARVRAEFGGARCRLVLVFTCHDKGKFPAGITVLPSPQFTEADVKLWAVEVVSRRREWAGAMAETWARWLWSQALLDDVPDACLLYEAMDESIKVFRFQKDASKFLAELENLRTG